MRLAQYRLNRARIFRLALLLCAIAFAPPSGAATPDVLRDIWVLYQNGQWHVVLIVSGSIPYKTLEASDPPRVVLDLPNTSSKTMITSPIRKNGIVGTVKSATVVHEPQPLTRVEIALNRDISYKIKRLQGKIWLTFDETSPAPTVEQSPHLQITGTEGKDPPARPKATQTTTATQTLAEQPSPSSLPLGEKRFSLASKILAIEPVTMDDDLDIHIIGDGRLDHYDISLLSEPPRLVVDLIGVKSTEVKHDLALSGPWVRKVRVGRHQDRVRVVFDLLFDPDAIPKAELPYEIILEGNRMVVSFLPVSTVPAQ